MKFSAVLAARLRLSAQRCDCGFQYWQGQQGSLWTMG
jgi:hypothetical protein